MVSSTARPHFTPGKDPVPILQEAGWAPGPVWKGLLLLLLLLMLLPPLLLLKVKLKRSRYRPGVAQRVGRGIAVLFHDHGTGRW